MRNERLRQLLQGVPTTPGVYLMKDAAGNVLYVGKAANLRSRVRSYFQPSAKPHTPLIAAMLERVWDIEVLHTATEVDALVLENNLIKQHQPRYNIKLKDDKRYPYLCVTTSEPFPRIRITRTVGVENDGNRYWGPFVHSKATREDRFKQLTRVFPIRTCHLDLKAHGNAHRVCLDYHIGKCPGPLRRSNLSGGVRGDRPKRGAVFERPNRPASERAPGADAGRRRGAGL
ncbi:MAG: hypothetical protein KatS3mg115_2396 [Candidatus Poribacteria bacterium]|nr:MAG: hypothetical protein KatS3mg115_2396 [Candidatus Poribacteria bacterium]